MGFRLLSMKSMSRGGNSLKESIRIWWRRFQRTMTMKILETRRWKIWRIKFKPWRMRRWILSQLAAMAILRDSMIWNSCRLGRKTNANKRRNRLTSCWESLPTAKNSLKKMWIQRWTIRCLRRMLKTTNRKQQASTEGKCTARVSATTTTPMRPNKRTKVSKGNLTNTSSPSSNNKMGRRTTLLKKIWKRSWSMG